MDSPEDVKDAISKSFLKFPCVLVAYAGGDNIPDPVTSTGFGDPMHFRHDCGFSVIVADNSPQRAHRTKTVYKMIAMVLDKLTGLRLIKEVEDVKYQLNTSVFVPESVITIAKIPNMTAYGIPFETSFKWSSPDRTEAGTDVSELVVGANALNDAGTRRLPPELPGVAAVVGS
jgi:hypothetical protein